MEIMFFIMTIPAFRFRLLCTIHSQFVFGPINTATLYHIFISNFRTINVNACYGFTHVDPQQLCCFGPQLYCYRKIIFLKSKKTMQRFLYFSCPVIQYQRNCFFKSNSLNLFDINCSIND